MKDGDNTVDMWRRSVALKMFLATFVDYALPVVEDNIIPNISGLVRAVCWLEWATANKN